MTCPQCGAAVDALSSVCPECRASLDVGVLQFLDVADPPRVLRPRDYTLGRAAENDISILHASVSRQHARLVWQGGQFTIEDLDSRLGLFVDDARVRRAVLVPGSIIRLGSLAVRFAAPAPATENGSGEDRFQLLLLSVLEAINSTLVLSQVLEKVLDAVMGITGAERGFLFLQPSEGQAGGYEEIAGLRLRVARGRRAGIPLEGGISTLVLQQVQESGCTVATGNALDDPELRASLSVASLSLRTIVCIPFLSPRPHPGQETPQVLGAIYVDNHALSDPFSPESLKAAEGVTRHAALAIENARLFEHEEHRVRELQKARDQALEASRVKGSFLANMSHELHTPLNAIIGYAEMVADRARELQQDDMVADLDKIRASGKSLLRIIDDILDISRVQDGTLTLRPEPVDLSWLVSELAEKARPLAARNGNALEVRVPDDLGSALIDGKRLRQALTNVLSNAAKFTERGDVCLEVRRESVEGTDWITFDVIDTGIGMTAEQAARAFEPFTQADSSLTRKYGGTGLGLALSRTLTEAMGGTISVESAPGAGSRFRLRVPAAPLG